jgi:ADP-ribose pyrophosphatase YjhB (NUDIX family)
VRAALKRRAYRIALPLLHAYWRVAQPQTRGVTCAITRDNEVLLVRHTYGDGHLWGLPGGLMRSGESPSETARREIAEELGLEIKRWELIGTIRDREHGRHGLVFCLRAPAPAANLDLDAGEIAAAGWFPRGALPEQTQKRTRAVMARLAASGR